jgi:MbtH protein
MRIRLRRAINQAGGKGAMPEETAVMYVVVRNDEEQFSIWPADHEVPGGWQVRGVPGTKEACLGHIREVWTDMRPLSLRRHMGEV